MESPPDEIVGIQPPRLREVAYGLVPHMRIRATVFNIVFVLIAYSLAMGAIFLATVGMRMAIPINLGFAIIMGIMAASATVGPMIVDRHRNGALLARFSDSVAEEDTANPEFARTLLELDHASKSLRLRGRERWPWHALAKACAAADIGIPSTIACRSYREPLEAIPSEAAMLEPETILTSAPQRGVMVLMIAIFGVQGLMALVNGYWIGVAACLALMGCFAIQIPAFRDLIPALRPESNAPVAGVGFIRNVKGEIWTIDDSLMILAGRKSGGQAVFVYVAGPAGWLLLTYSNVKDPEFIKLWQRWNHPHPRPELAS